MRSKMFLRTLAVFVAITLLINVGYPTVSYALSFNMLQPEYTSYGNANSQEVVNPQTGDFNMNLPIMELPGVEGSFSLPLTYHAGITTDQEASWVGLGWNMNVGAIIRTPSSTPDDFNGEQINTGISTPGIESASSNLILPLITYNWGHVGNKNFSGGYVWAPMLYNIGFGDNSGTGTILGFINYNPKANGGTCLSIDPVGLCMFVVTVVLTVVTWGVYGIAAAAADLAVQAAIEAGVQTAATWVASSLAKTYSGMQTNQSRGMYFPSRNESNCQNYVVYKECQFKNGVIDYKTQMQSYGALYLQNQPVGDMKRNTAVRKGDKYVQSYYSNVAGDSYRFIDQDEFMNVNTPTSLAYDRFNVMGEGVDGVIQPYRLETGSCASEYLMKNFTHNRLAAVQFNANYKVPFRYSGIMTNSYDHHQGEKSDGTSIHPEDANPTGVLMAKDNTFPCAFQLTEEDVNLYQKRQEDDRDGLYTQNYDGKNFKFLAQGKHIQWYTNDEIRHMNNPALHSGTQNYMLDAGFVDWLSGVNANGDYSANAQRDNFRRNLPSSGIGGFSITREDGTTYHYTLPVYNKKVKSEAITTSHVDEANKDVKLTNTSDILPDFAVSWLLTAITGPDFVDRGERGYIDESDWGKWTKFDYGKFSDNYTWRVPYSGKTTSFDGKTEQYSLGICQTYYLNSIQNRSHIALFEKSYRNDAHSAKENASDQISSALKLDNIYIMDYENYKKLSLKGFSTDKGNNTLLANGDTYSDVYDTDDFEPFRKEFNSSSIRKIAFKYDYALCQGIPNSFINPLSTTQPTVGENGKLTLKSVSILGKDDFKYSGDFKFTYASNPSYNKDQYDGWGMYCSTANSSASSHVPSASVDAAAWSLTKIEMPMGASMEIEYEADKYNEICGTPLSYYYPEYGNNEKLGGGLRVKKIKQTDAISGSVKESVYDYQNGVASTEPELINVHFYNKFDVNNQFDEHKLKYERFKYFYDFPFTPVLYKKVIVKSGTTNDYLGTIEYEFLTPNMDDMFEYKLKNSQAMSFDFVDSNVEPVEPIQSDGTNPNDPTDYLDLWAMFGEGNTVGNELASTDNDGNVVGVQIVPGIRQGLSYFSEIVDKTAYIGQMKSILKRNQANDVTDETIYTYSNSWKNGSGVYTEGLIQSDLVSVGSENLNQLKIHKTLKKSLPFFVSAVTTKDRRYGIERTLTLNDLDPITGVTTSTSTSDSYGNTILTQIEHAYKHYASMGPKAENFTNKNMLAQQVGQYVYKYPTNDITKKTLVSAEISTWSNDIDVHDSWANATIKQNNVWRKHQNYVWVGTPTDVLDRNGNYPLSSFQPFDWANLANNETKGWQKTSEVLMCDPFSHILSSKNISGQFMASKMDTLHRMPLVVGSHCKQGEIAYSGAEYYYGNRSSDGGVLRVDGYPSSQFKHTGRYSLQVANGKEAFRYTIPVAELNTKRKYRASVWAYLPGTSERDLSSLELSYTIDGKQRGVALGNSTYKAGSWYLYNLDMVPVAGKDLVVSCKNKAYRDIYLDDFRVHPLDAPVMSYVYDPITLNMMVKLDGDNLYSRYEYDKVGRIVRVFEERFGITEKLVSQKAYNVR